MTKWLKVRSSYDGYLIPLVYMADVAQLENALQAEHQLVTNTGNTLPAYQRVKILEKTVDLVEVKAEQFSRQEVEEGDKQFSGFRIEPARAIQGILKVSQSISSLTDS